jgi:hypothetical protein
MILLSAALGLEPVTPVEGLDQVFPARRVAATFELFLLEVLCVATRPAATCTHMVVVDEPALRQRHGTFGMSELRGEAARWVSALGDDASPAECRRREAALVGGLLRPTADECTYRLAPAGVPDSRPIVLVTVDALERFGRVRLLQALWESERALGAGDEFERGALFDQLQRPERAALSPERNRA